MMIKKTTIAILLLICSFVQAGLSPEKFHNPPDDCRPMTWMHIMNNNASKEGLTKDLQALVDVGVGGALFFSVKKGIADGQVMFNSPEFREILVHGARQADRLGIKIGVHNCDGWSASGGPWVQPEDAMKRVVWSETVVEGGKADVRLSRPAVRGGFYRDIAVVAYPATKEELDIFNNPPVLTASAKQKDLEKLTDNDLGTEVMFSVSRKDKTRPWLLFSYEHPFGARSIHIEHRSRNCTAVLLASQDGQKFEKVIDLKPSYRPGKIFWAYEASFPVVQARYFKVEFQTRIQLVSVDLVPFKRLPAWLAQTSVTRSNDNQLANCKYPSADSFIPLEKIRVITDSLDSDGRCQTELPGGIWRILRFGYTITGAYNYPATDSGRGWECDKLNASSLDKHFSEYVGKVAKECGSLAGKSFCYSEIDSYEMGGQNWTDGLEKTFKEEKGYDLVPFLPLLAGRMIGDPSIADAVLGDFRELISGLMEKNYFKRFTELCHQNGMESYIEPYGNAPFNNLTVGGHADIPMGEFWMDGRGIWKSAISSAHTYGKPVISAESFTSWKDLNWKVHPYLMKESGDMALAAGINEFVFHRFAHQANQHVVPGMTMDSIGSHIDRTQTWWYNAGKAWMKYLQRGSWILRQGVPVSDLLVYVGEGTPNHEPGRNSVKLPAGFNMDNCDTRVLFDRIRVENGKLVLPEGTNYSVLLLYNCEQISMRTLNRLYELVKAGAVLAGPKPLEPIGYIERTTGKEDFCKLADSMWPTDGRPNHVGKGIVITDKIWPAENRHINIAPDLIIQEDPDAAFIHRKIGSDDFYFFQNPSEQARLLHCSFRIKDRIPEFWHADTGRIEIQGQFTQVDGRTNLAVPMDPYGSVFVVFRQRSKEFDPVVKVTGPDEKARVFLDGKKKIRLSAFKNGNYRIERAGGVVQKIKVDQLQRKIPLEGSWEVIFDGPGLKGDPKIEFSNLTDWKDYMREDIRYFSGTAGYHKTVHVPQNWLGGSKRIFLELGRVEIAAEVIINGQVADILWKPPFVTDITQYIKPGKNNFEIKVTNLWTNRLIGDESLLKTDGYKRNARMPDWYINNQPMPEGPRSTFTTYNFYDKDRTLLPSGLLGPVILFQKILIPID